MCCNLSVGSMRIDCTFKITENSSLKSKLNRVKRKKQSLFHYSCRGPMNMPSFYERCRVDDLLFSVTVISTLAYLADFTLHRSI